MRVLALLTGVCRKIIRVRRALGMQKSKIAHEESNASPPLSAFVGAIIGKVAPMGNVCSDINILRKV